MFLSPPLHPGTSRSIRSSCMGWGCTMLNVSFFHAQVLLEVAIIAILVEEENTSACQTRQSMTSTRMGFSQTPTFMVLNIKSARIIHFKTACMITTSHVPCVTFSHVPPSWWYLQGMTVPPVGPWSIMGIWWQISLPTSIQPISFALMERPNLSTAATPTKMVPYCISWKDSAGHYHASPTLLGESWHALYAQNELKQVKNSASVWEATEVR